MKINIDDVIERIELLLKARGEKKTDLARNLNFNPHQFVDWSYKKQIPNSERLYNIAKYLGVTFEYLVEGKEIDDSIAVAISYLEGIPEENRKAVIAMIKSQYDLFNPGE